MNDESNPENFTFKIFHQMVKILKNKGFMFCHFNDQQPTKRIYMRHDVDFSLRQAERFAQQEAKLNIPATYFIMINNSIYNLLDPWAQGIIKNILSMGHDIGLHFNLTTPHNWNNLETEITKQCLILENTIEHPIKSFSFHRPRHWREQGFESATITVKGKINTYNLDFFSPDCYISDSNNSWQCSNPLKFLQEYPGDILQILLHPIWWGEQPLTLSKKINACLDELSAHHLDFMKDNIRALGEKITPKRKTGTHANTNKIYFSGISQ